MESGAIKAGGVDIAYDFVRGRGPAVIFLGGYASTRKSTKASALFDWALSTGRTYVRFDYSGHGESGGKFIDATLGLWLNEARAVVEQVAPEGQVILAGSSMGAWIALLLARENTRIAGLLLIACAADFTEEVIRPNLPEAALEALRKQGYAVRPAQPGRPEAVITSAFLEDASKHLLLGGPINISCPVRMFHGLGDRDVPWSISARVLGHLKTGDALLTLVKDGDHSLSSAKDISRYAAALEELFR